MEFISVLPDDASDPVEQVGTYYYYYGNGEKYFLELNTDYLFISSTDDNGIAPVKLLRNLKISEVKTDGVKSITRTVEAERMWAEVEVENSTGSVQYKESLRQMRELNKDIIVAPYFKSASGKKIGLSNYFYVKLKELKDTVALKEMAIETKVRKVSAVPEIPLWFVMSVTPETEKNAMEMANFYQESNLFQYAEPDLMEENLITNNDPLSN